MPTLWITEHDQVTPDRLGETIQCVKGKYRAQQQVSISASSAQSSAFNGKTNCIRVISDTPCYVNIDSNPTAVTGQGIRLIADIPEYFGVAAGDKIAVIS